MTVSKRRIPPALRRAIEAHGSRMFRANRRQLRGDQTIVGIVRRDFSRHQPG